MTTKFRKISFTVLFAATAAAAITGATLRGETKEPSLAETCAAAAWPMIPASCLEGGRGHDIRTVVANSAADEAMRIRFETAFN